MLLERVEKGVIVNALYESSNIVSSVYDTTKKDLTIIFKNGGSYTYRDVSHTDYFRFETAESQGRVLNSNIKAYSFIKNDNVDVNEILSEVNKIKEDEKLKVKNELITFVKFFLKHHDDTNNIDEGVLANLEKMISLYRNSL